MRILISMLRALNMTGHNSMRMSDLSELYKKLGFSDAETYIQSGNVVFSYNGDLTDEEISSNIEAAISENYKFKIPVIIRSVKEILEIQKSNPFVNEDGFDPSKMSVIFLREKTSREQIIKMSGIDFPPDRYKIKGKEIYIYCPNGFGKTKLYTNFFENKMGVTGTARNWKTVARLLQIAEKKL